MIYEHRITNDKTISNGGVNDSMKIIRLDVSRTRRKRNRIRKETGQKMTSILTTASSRNWSMYRSKRQ